MSYQNVSLLMALLPSSAQATAQLSWAELALFSSYTAARWLTGIIVNKLEISKPKELLSEILTTYHFKVNSTDLQTQERGLSLTPNEI